MRPAPWITPRVLADGRKLAGASLVTIPVARCPHSPLSLSHSDSRYPRQRKHCLLSHPGTPPLPDRHPTGHHSGVDDLIIGIAAAAEYLGYDKPDSFRRARTRHPIPGETRTTDGRPAWTPSSSLWHTQRYYFYFSFYQYSFFFSYFLFLFYQDCFFFFFFFLFFLLQCVLSPVASASITSRATAGQLLCAFSTGLVAQLG